MASDDWNLNFRLLPGNSSHTHQTISAIFYLFDQIRPELRIRSWTEWRFCSNTLSPSLKTSRKGFVSGITVVTITRDSSPKSHRLDESQLGMAVPGARKMAGGRASVCPRRSKESHETFASFGHVSVVANDWLTSLRLTYRRIFHAWVKFDRHHVAAMTLGRTKSRTSARLTKVVDWQRRCLKSPSNTGMSSDTESRVDDH